MNPKEVHLARLNVYNVSFKGHRSAWKLLNEILLYALLLSNFTAADLVSAELELHDTSLYIHSIMRFCGASLHRRINRETNVHRRRQEVSWFQLPYAVVCISIRTKTRPILISFGSGGFLLAI